MWTHWRPTNTATTSSVVAAKENAVKRRNTPYYDEHIETFLLPSVSSCVTKLFSGLDIFKLVVDKLLFIENALFKRCLKQVHVFFYDEYSDLWCILKIQWKQHTNLIWYYCSCIELIRYYNVILIAKISSHFPLNAGTSCPFFVTVYLGSLIKFTTILNNFCLLGFLILYKTHFLHCNHRCGQIFE